MYDTVTNSVDGIHGLDDAAFSVCQDIQYELYGYLVIRDGLLDFLFLPIPFMGKHGIGKPDFSTKPLP